MGEMTVRGIIAEYLRVHGYAGLYGFECGCSLDELMPCDHKLTPGRCDFAECLPGVKHPCDCGEGCEFHMGPPVGVEE